MRRNVLYFLMIAGAVLLILNLWTADFDSAKINFFSAGASIIMVIYSYIQLKKKPENEN